MVRYTYLSGARNGWSYELECLGFPRQPNAPLLKRHGAFYADEEDFKAFFRQVVEDTVRRPFQKPRIQYIFVERGNDIFLWSRSRLSTFYEHGRITSLKERQPSGFWTKLLPK